MSIYNRKMFNRSARNALNASAGIQSFNNGGGVFNLAQRPVASDIQNQILTQQAANQQAASLGSNLRRPSGTIITGLDGNKYFVPSKAASPSQRGLLDIASQAIQEGFGSLNPLQSGALGALEGGESARKVATPITDYLGDSTLSSIVGAGADVAGQIGGGLAGGISSLAASDDGDTSTLSGRLGTVMPGDAALEALGIFKFPSYSAEDETAIPEPKSAIELGIPVSPTGLGGVFAKDVITEFDTPMPRNIFDEAGRKRLEQERLAREAMKESGVVDIDEETGEVTAVEPPPKPVKVSAAKDPLASMVDDSGAAEQAPGLLKEEIEEEDGSSENQESQKERLDTDPDSGTKVDDPYETQTPAVRAALAEQARQANASDGIPNQSSVAEEVKTAVESGTGSPEDIKAEFLKLLPKYEEDPSLSGLNLALMGFAIAAGESDNPLTNIANGMNKVLPKFIKSAEKRKSFERETELLASKYTIQRLESERKQDLEENTYIAKEEFTHPVTGQKINRGQLFRLNDRGFMAAEEAGITGKLTTPTLYQEILENNSAEAIAKIEAGDAPIDELYEDPVDVEIEGIGKISIRRPTLKGQQLNLKALPSSPGDWKSFTRGYASALDEISFMDNGMQSALDLVSQGGIGATGTVGRFTDILKAVTNFEGARQVGESIGLDYDELSAGGNLAALNRSLALQLAPVLLGESGKTISDNDRRLVAQALGYRVDGENILLNDGIGSFFQSEADAKRKIQEIQRILRKNAEGLHGKYMQGADLLELTLETPEQARARAGASYSVVAAPENPDFDYEIKIGSN